MTRKSTASATASKSVAIVTAYGEALKGADRAAALSWPAFQAIADLRGAGRSQDDIAKSCGIAQAQVSRALEIVGMVDAGTLKSPRMIAAPKWAKDLDLDQVTNGEDGAALLALRGALSRKADRERLRSVKTDAPLTAPALLSTSKPKVQDRAPSTRKGPERTVDSVVNMLAGSIVAAGREFDVDVDDLIAKIAERVDERLNDEQVDEQAA